METEQIYVVAILYPKDSEAYVIGVYDSLELARWETKTVGSSKDKIEFEEHTVSKY